MGFVALKLFRSHKNCCGPYVSYRPIAINKMEFHPDISSLNWTCSQQVTIDVCWERSNIFFYTKSYTILSVLFMSVSFPHQLEELKMADPLSYTLSPLYSSVSSVPADSGLESNTTTCQDWEQAHHLLFHLANLSLGLGFLIPTTIGLHMIFLRLLLITGIQRPLWFNRKVFQLNC